MNDVVERAVKEARRDPPETARAEGPPVKRALELVAMRGKDVLGVRHLLDGGRAFVGAAQDSLVRLSMGDFGGAPVVVGEVAGGRCTLRVPPKARARVHGADGLGRLFKGPEELVLDEGDRAVVVMGAVQIRARLVAVQTSARPGGGGSTARWVALVGALYLAALALCAVLAPRDRAELEPGQLRRAVDLVTAQAVWATIPLDADDPSR